MWTLLLWACGGAPTPAPAPDPAPVEVAPVDPVALTYQDGCKDGTVFFFCHAGINEVLVCGEGGADGWLHAQWGTQRQAADLAFPGERAGSLARFKVEDRVHIRSMGTVLRFEHDGQTFEITEMIGGGGEDGDVNNFVGVRAHRADEIVDAFTCDAALQSDWDGLKAALGGM